MSMSKKDYEAIAAAIRQARCTNAYEDARIAAPSGVEYYTYHIVNSIASYCAQQSESFDRARFLKACGVQS